MRKAFLMVLATILLLPIFGLAQDKELYREQRVLHEKKWGNEPVKIETIKTAEREIKFDEKFIAGEDWYKGLTVTVRNISTSPIAQIQLILKFPALKDDSETTPSGYVFFLNYGRDPLDKGLGELKLLQPDETVEIKLPDANFSDIKGYLVETDVQTWRIDLGIEGVIYASRTKWFSGSIMYPDPKKPRSWLSPNLTEEELKQLDSQPRPVCNQEEKPQTSNPFQKISFRPVLSKLGRKQFFLELLMNPGQINETRPCNKRFSRNDPSHCGSNTPNTCIVVINEFTIPQNRQLLDSRENVIQQMCFDQQANRRCDNQAYLYRERLNCRALVACGEVELTGLSQSNQQNMLPLCEFGLDPDCCPTSPILIDMAGNGFNLTNAANGVMFDFNGDAVRHQTSWTSANSDDAWLFLDRNNNGQVDNALELFGNFTPQPDPPAGEKKNGFLALKEYDKAANGGNNDNQIDMRDSVFANLKLWTDSNHNGISEANELQNLSASAVRAIELNYQESRRVDEHGNRFKYRAIVRDVRGAQVGRWAWDVFLILQ